MSRRPEKIPSQRCDLSEQDQQLFYPILLIRQFARMLSSLGLALLLCAALIAELDQLAQEIFGEHWKLVSLFFVMLLALSVNFLYGMLQDFVDDVKSGKRLQNSYTLISSVSMLIATATLVQAQVGQFESDDALSIFELLWQAIF